MAIQTFTASLSVEKSGSIRGKIPAQLVTALGASSGDVLEFQVNGKVLVGGRVLKGKDADKARQSRPVFGRERTGTAVKKPAKAQGSVVNPPSNGKAVSLPKPLLKKPVTGKKPFLVAKPAPAAVTKPKLVAKPANGKSAVKPPVKLAKPAPKAAKRATKVIITKPKKVVPTLKGKPRFSI
jgi:antitoxin component of MazEF toxin-antitoxin module